MGRHVVAGMRVGLKGQGRWMVESVRDGYVQLVRRCRDGSVECWKVLETRCFL